MDGPGREWEPRERLRQSQHHRASSRESSAHTHMTSKTASSSPSQSPGAIQSVPPPTHRHHRTNSGRFLESARSPSRLSKETTVELLQAGAPVSSFLQERLDQQRRAESERAARKMGGDLSASTGDIRDRDAYDAPARSATALGRRLPSSTEDNDSNPDGMGLLEMEKTVCTLHKQNFDLKLELYHRRERQDALEEKMHRLEAENNELKELQEKITAQLVTREKAVTEAVGLIVQLEAKYNELLRETEMVRQVESDGTYCHSRSNQYEHRDNEGAPLTPKLKGLESLGMVDGAKSLERVPSFLSERSEQTENLRSVILGGRGSFAHVHKMSNSSAAQSEINRIATGSPSLSVLSESSFVSVYGSKNETGQTPGGPAPESTVAEDNQLEGLPSPAQESRTPKWRSPRETSANRMSKDAPQGGARLSAHLQPLSSVIETTSPLQKIEKLDKQLPSAEIFRTLTFGHSHARCASASPARSTRPARAAARQERSGSIQHIVTTGPTNKELATSHVLPPTPDTVASSTLRKHGQLTNSRDSLGEDDFPTAPGKTHARAASQCLTSPKGSGDRSQRVSTTAFTGLRGLTMPPIDTDPSTRTNNRISLEPPARPRSADKTTISRPRAHSWGSDSDSDGGVEAHSDESTFDYWMRESARPNVHTGGMSSPTGDERRLSPDLLSFPADDNGWGTDALFGALRGEGFLRSPVPDLRHERFEDIPTPLGPPETPAFDPQEMGYAPPTPDRRSSLHARTSSSSVARSISAMSKRTPVSNSSAMKAKGRSNSIDSTARLRTLTSHIDPSEAAPSPSKRQYPPISGVRRSLGLNTLFRRAGSESPGPSSATDGAFPAHLPPHLQSSFTSRSGRSSVPPPPTKPWVLRPPALAAKEIDDLDSATPPPIMRSRGMSQPPIPELPVDAPMAQQGAPLADHEGADTAPSSPAQNAPSAGKRRWLHLGRMSTLKNRIG